MRSSQRAALTSVRRLLVREVADAVERAAARTARAPRRPSRARSRAAGSRRARRAAAASGRRTPASSSRWKRQPARPGQRADRPAVPLQRAVRGGRDLHRLAAARLGLGVREAGPAPAPQQLADVGAVVARAAAPPAARGSWKKPMYDDARSWRAGRAAAPAQPQRVRHRRRRRAGAPARVQRRDASRRAGRPSRARRRAASRAPSARTIPATSDGQRVGVVAARRLVGGAVAAQVGGDGAVAGVAERLELVPPGPPELAGSRAAAAPAGRRRVRPPRGGSGRRSRSPRGGVHGPSTRTDGLRRRACARA